MVTLPDPPRDRADAPHSFRETLFGPEAATQFGARCPGLWSVPGVVLTAAALALWMSPAAVSAPGDLMMRALVSATLLALAGLCARAARPDPAGPQVEVDTAARRLRVIRLAGDGRARLVTLHPFDSLSDLALRDGLLIARDARGAQIVALPMPDRDSERRLRWLIGQPG